MSENYVDASTRRLKLLQEEIEQYEFRIKELKDQISLDAGRLIKTAPTEDERVQLASEVYWFLEFVPSTIVYRAMGASQNQILKYILPAAMTINCRDCGEKFDLMMTSRTKVRSLRRAYQEGYKPGQVRCPACEERHALQDAQETAKWRRAQEEQKAEIQRLKYMPYAEYLQTEHWRNLRGQMLKRAKFHCQLCNRGDLPFHVHHRSYEHRGEEPYSDLIVLCAECHKTFHENGAIA